MTLTVAVNRIVVSLIVAGIATLVWWLVHQLGGSEGVALWMFGTVLLALSVVIPDAS